MKFISVALILPYSKLHHRRRWFWMDNNDCGNSWNNCTHMRFTAWGNITLVILYLECLTVRAEPHSQQLIFIKHFDQTRHKLTDPKIIGSGFGKFRNRFGKKVQNRVINWFLFLHPSSFGCLFSGIYHLGFVLGKGSRPDSFRENERDRSGFISTQAKLG